MSLKILGGLYKGLSLDLPLEDVTRPTGNLLKRKIFDSINDFEGVIFCDLFAGSGAMGFEAFSLGAKHVYFIEDHPKVYKLLKKNGEKFKQGSFTFYQKSALTWLKSFKLEYLQLPEEVREQMVIYLDPPYERSELYELSLKELVNGGWYHGHLWIEAENKKGLKLEHFSYLEEYRYKENRSLFTHGDSYILCLKIFIKS